MQKHLIALGVSIAVLGLIGYVLHAAVTSSGGALILLALVHIVAFALLHRRWQLHRAVSAFRKTHGAFGRDLLIVYSASPHWQSYIDEKWIHRWQERVIVLNRSSPDWHTRPEAKLWRRVAGQRNHTPIAIVIPRHGAPRVVRFYSEFLDYKHGKSSALHAREAELENILNSMQS